MKKLSQKYKDAMVKLYLAGMSAKKSGAKFGVSGTTCFNELKRRKIRTRSKKIPKRCKNTAIKMYLAGKTIREAAKFAGCSASTCLNELRSQSIPRRNRSEAIRKYAVDETFFNKINTEESAYWLGFLSADGYIDIKGTQVILRLAKKDRNHIVKFLKAIKSKHLIKKVVGERLNKKHISFVVNICSIKLVSALKSLGVTTNKSFTLKPCKLVPLTLVRHYWRGFIDGDGCLNKRPTYWRISLVGSLFSVKAFRKWVESFVPIKAKVRKNGSIYVIEFGGQRLTPIIVKTLYGKAKIYLDRKMKLAKKVMKLI